MKTLILKITAACCAICLSIGFLLISFTFVAFSKNFYLSETKKYNSLEKLNISQADAENVIDQLILYFSGKSDTLQVVVTQNGKETDFYTEDELMHMVDVKILFGQVTVFSVVLLLIGAGGLIGIFLLKRKEGKKTAVFGLVAGNAVVLSIAILLGMSMLIDFEFMFDLFHRIFFSQGNYAFSYTSNMLKLLPLELFIDAAATILVCGLAFVIVLFISGLVLLKVLKKKQNGQDIRPYPQP